MKLKTLLVLSACLFLFNLSLSSYPWPNLKCNFYTCYNPKVIKSVSVESLGEEMSFIEEAYVMQSPFNAKEKFLVTISMEGSDMVTGCFQHYNETSKEIGEMLGCVEMGNSGRKLYLRGGKNLYAQQGHFKKQSSHKYQLTKNNGIKEVKQPFMYLGIKTKVSLPSPEYCGPYKGPKTLALYQKKNQKSEKIAVLPVGYEIEVLLQDGKWYLVKSSFGLVGWARNKSDYHSLFGVPDYHCVG
jgi:hypothetical protein